LKVLLRKLGAKNKRNESPNRNHLGSPLEQLRGGSTIARDEVNDNDEKEIDHKRKPRVSHDEELKDGSDDPRYI